MTDIYEAAQRWRGLPPCNGKGCTDECLEQSLSLLTAIREQDERMLKLERERDGLALQLKAGIALHEDDCADAAKCPWIRESQRVLATLAGVPDER